MNGERRVPVDDGHLTVTDQGRGEPVLLVQTALIADELRPLADRLRAGGLRTVSSHRRGYGGSSLATAPGSIVRDAHDCRVLLRALEIPCTHVLGVSYSAAVVLQLAVDAPERVHSLTVVEPAPTLLPQADEFATVSAQLVRVRHERGPAAALDALLQILTGPQWRA